MGKGLPDRWLDYSNIGKVIKGTRFISFKVPLNRNLLNLAPPEYRNWGIQDLLQVDKLGLVIDLTHTDRYYNKSSFFNTGIFYEKIYTVGHVVPNNNVVNKFFNCVDNFLQENEEKLIGVHCTHGLNRTGYMVCRYMIERLGFQPDEAIFEFNSARGHEQERENYIADLKKRSTINVKESFSDQHNKRKERRWMTDDQDGDDTEFIDYQENDYRYQEGEHSPEKRLRGYDEYQDGGYGRNASGYDRGRGEYPDREFGGGSGGYQDGGFFAGSGGYQDQGRSIGYQDRGFSGGRGGYQDRGFGEGRGEYPDRGFGRERGGYEDRGFGEARDEFSDRGFGGYQDRGFGEGRGGYQDRGFGEGRGRYPDRGFGGGRGGYQDRGFGEGRGGYPQRGFGEGRDEYPQRGFGEGRGGYPDRGFGGDRDGYQDQGFGRGRDRYQDRRSSGYQGEGYNRYQDGEFGGRRGGHQDRGYQDIGRGGFVGGRDGYQERKFNGGRNGYQENGNGKRRGGGKGGNEARENGNSFVSSRTDRKTKIKNKKKICNDNNEGVKKAVNSRKVFDDEDEELTTSTSKKHTPQPGPSTTDKSIPEEMIKPKVISFRSKDYTKQSEKRDITDIF